MINYLNLFAEARTDFRLKHGFTPKTVIIDEALMEEIFLNSLHNKDWSYIIAGSKILGMDIVTIQSDSRLVIPVIDNDPTNILTAYVSEIKKI